MNIHVETPTLAAAPTKNWQEIEPTKDTAEIIELIKSHEAAAAEVTKCEAGMSKAVDEDDMDSIAHYEDKMGHLCDIQDDAIRAILNYHPSTLAAVQAKAKHLQEMGADMFEAYPGRIRALIDGLTPASIEVCENFSDIFDVAYRDWLLASVRVYDAYIRDDDPSELDCKSEYSARDNLYSTKVDCIHNIERKIEIFLMNERGDHLEEHQIEFLQLILKDLRNCR